MPYYRCPECALTVQSAAGRFAAKLCPHCSVPLEHTDRVYAPQREPAAISRRFVAEPRAASAARRALTTLSWGLEPAVFHVAALLTTELVANAVEHGGSATGGSVYLEATLTDARVQVAVGDGGSGFAPAPRAPDAPLDSHWGLHLVEHLSDRWGVVPKPQTLVWFELDRPLPAGTGRDRAAAPGNHDAGTLVAADASGTQQPS
jgi:anti-sigma regulatory factor (Ser/Thr protein kinase)